MKTLGSSKNSVLKRLLAAITLAGIASSASAGPVNQCRWDELSHQLVAAEHEKTQTTGALAADDAWLPRPTHSPAIRSQPGDSDSTFHTFAISEQTLIPLPAAEWSGLVGLVGLALVRARKSLRKMFL